MTTQLHLAQVNIARMKGPLDSPVMAGFVARLDEINALADRSPGFVWRLQTGERNATYLRPYDDDRILFNLSVWESIDRSGSASSKLHIWRSGGSPSIIARQSMRRRSGSRILMTTARPPSPSPSWPPFRPIRLLSGLPTGPHSSHARRYDPPNNTAAVAPGQFKAGLRQARYARAVS